MAKRLVQEQLCGCHLTKATSLPPDTALPQHPCVEKRGRQNRTPRGFAFGERTMGGTAPSLWLSVIPVADPPRCGLGRRCRSHHRREYQSTDQGDCHSSRAMFSGRSTAA